MLSTVTANNHTYVKPSYRIQLRDYCTEGISLVTTDEGFNLPVPLATNARQCALKLLNWMTENMPKAIAFAVALIESLKLLFRVLYLRMSELTQISLNS